MRRAPPFTMSTAERSRNRDARFRPESHEEKGVNFLTKTVGREMKPSCELVLQKEDYQTETSKRMAVNIMDFNLSEEHHLIRASVRELYFEKYVEPIAEMTDAEAKFPADTIKKLVEQDFLGIPLPSGIWRRRGGSPELHHRSGRNIQGHARRQVSRLRVEIPPSLVFQFLSLEPKNRSKDSWFPFARAKYSAPLP